MKCLHSHEYSQGSIQQERVYNHHSLIDRGLQNPISLFDNIQSCNRCLNYHVIESQ